MNKSSPPHGAGRVIHSGSQVPVVQSGLSSRAPANQIRLSLSELTTLRWSLVEEVRRLKSLQFDSIGLWRPKVAEIGTTEAASLLRSAGMSVSSLSFIGGFTGTNGLSFDDAMADARDAINDAAALGAGSVIAVSGTRNGHTIRHSRRLLVEALRELADFAASRAVRLCVLPMHAYFERTWTYLNSLDETLEILARVRHSSAALAFDCYQLQQEPHLVGCIPDVAGLTGIVQVSDARRLPAGAADRCLPGEGNIPLGEIVRAFQRSGYAGYYDLQVWSAAAWQDSAWSALQGRENLLRLAQWPAAMTR